MTFEVGDRSVLAIEAELEEPVDSYWVFGHLRLHVGGTALGDWADTTAFRGVLSWLRELVDDPPRWDVRLSGLSTGDLFHALMEPHRKAIPTDIPASMAFHIAYVWMSSFDRWHLLLVDDPDLGQRVLWQEADLPVAEALLPAREMQRVGQQCLDEVGRRYGALPQT